MTKTASKIDLCVICESHSKLAQAEAFAHEHKLRLFNDNKGNCELQLVFGETAISLYDSNLKTSIYVDFAEGALAHRQQFGGGRGQPIAKAIGLKHGITPTVLDVTAGLARDAYILASLGCTVTLVEQSPVLVTLIRDGIERGLLAENCAPILKDNLQLYQMNAIDYLENLDINHKLDVIYIDPMYPERKKSALVKKDMQILQHLLGKDQSDGELLSVALQSAKKRVVVKRPVSAGPINSIKPSTCVSSKKTRYDIYIINKPGEVED